MKRHSIYISESAAQQLDAAVGRVTRALGDDVAKHVVLSALIEAAAASSDAVAQALAQEKTAALAEQLRRLQDGLT